MSVQLDPFLVPERQSPFEAAIYVLRFIAPLRRALLAQRPSADVGPESDDRNTELALLQDIVRADAVRPSTRALSDWLRERKRYYTEVNEPDDLLYSLLGIQSVLSLFRGSQFNSRGTRSWTLEEQTVAPVSASGKDLIQALDCEHVMSAEDPNYTAGARTRWRDPPRVMYVPVKRTALDRDSDVFSWTELDDRFEFPLELDMRRYCVPKAEEEEEITVPTEYSLALVHTYIRKTERILSHQTLVRDLESESTCRWLMIDKKNRTRFCSHHVALEESFGSQKGRRVLGMVYLRSDMLPERHSLKFRAARALRQQPHHRLPAELPAELKAYLDQLE